MKLLLIAPASGRWHHVGRARRFDGRTFRFSLLSLLRVAAETPADVEVQVIDEQLDDVPWDLAWDLVGITCMTAAAPRAYSIADRFRSRGVPVALGGMHPTFLPREALAHADAICVGEAEGIWPQMVADARRGRLAGIYRAESPHGLCGLGVPPRGLLRARGYGTVQAVQATRGCPNHCAFCAVSAFHGGAYRRRPVSEVVAEVAALPRRFFVFVDDNLTADPTYATELFGALRPLGKRWVSQSTLRLTDRPELVRGAAEAGCIGLFVGLETLSDGSLDRIDKSFHRVAEYGERIDCLHGHGIGVEAGVVFGFDGDGPEVFHATLDALERLRVDAIQVSILTPLPGTPFFERMRERLVDSRWERYDFHHVVFRPARMTAAQLQSGHDWITREFYRPWRIARRLARIAVRRRGLRYLPFAAAINGAYYGRTVRWAIRGADPREIVAVGVSGDSETARRLRRRCS